MVNITPYKIPYNIIRQYWRCLKMKYAQYKIIRDALEQVNLLFELEESTGDFPVTEWSEAKELVRKALLEMKR